MLRPLWTELTSWLAANAPRALADLRPPVDPARLGAAEERLGFRMGAEITEWWHLHDGATTEASSILPGYYLLGIDGMLTHRRYGMEADLEVDLDRVLPEDSPEAGGRSWTFRPEFLPVGTDGAGNNLLVDGRPGARHGCLKDFDHEDGAHQPALYESLTDLLTQVVHSLRTGEPVRQRTPKVYEGTLSWDFS